MSLRSHSLFCTPRHRRCRPPRTRRRRRPRRPHLKMVKVEIVEERDPHFDRSPYASSSSSRTSSSVSLSSVASELDGEESFYDRLTALVDIVPPTTRHNIANRFARTTSFIKSTGKVVGNIVWIVTTSALLIGLPLALSLEDEAKIVAQEKEMLAQQQGQQQVRYSIHAL